jgi:uncharacterized membrane protein YeaQ/YmgE (transglycosylase-associated protein family)
MTQVDIGGLCFGLVVGWITYRTLRRKEGSAALSDISTVIGAVGGATVTALFKSQAMFAMYSIGLAIGFFLYFFVGLVVPEEVAPQAGWETEQSVSPTRSFRIKKRIVPTTTAYAVLQPPQLLGHVKNVRKTTPDE